MLAYYGQTHKDMMMSEFFESDRLEHGPSDYATKPDFTPLEWSQGLKLPAGSVLKLSQGANQQTYIFECIGLEGGRVTDGLLTVYGDGVPAEYFRTPARVNTLFPNPGAPPTSRFVEFEIDLDPTSVLRLSPVFKQAEIYYDETLAAEVAKQAMAAIQSQTLAVLNTEHGRETIFQLVALLEEMAEERESEELAQTAQIIGREILGRE